MVIVFTVLIISCVTTHAYLQDFGDQFLALIVVNCLKNKNCNKFANNRGENCNSQKYKDEDRNFKHILTFAWSYMGLVF